MKTSKIIGAISIATALGIGCITIIIKNDSSNHSTEYHTSSWYVSHPDVLKVDEIKCAHDAAHMTPAECQNVASASTILFAEEMRKAAIENSNKK